MISTKKIENLAPCGQPTSVHEIADRLFPAYTVDGGRVHLAGCTLDNRLFLQVTLLTAGGRRRFFLDLKGRKVDEDRAKELGLDDTQKLEKPLEPAWADIARLTQAALDMARDEFPGQFDDVELGVAGVGGGAGGAGQHEAAGETAPKFVAAAVWCKYAQGKLRFTIGGHSVDVPFADWAIILAPPPFVCPFTGEKTFHLAAASDGRIVAAERLATCEASGQRLVDNELVTCAASGKRISRELAQVCPVSDEHLLAEHLIECDCCGELVSPNCTSGGRCAACRRLEKLDHDDPRRQRLLDAYPALARRRGWKIAETAAVYILTRRGLLRRLLIVVDKTTLAPKRIATAGIFHPAWRQIDASRIDEILAK